MSRSIDNIYSKVYNKVMIDKESGLKYFQCNRCGYSWLPRHPVIPKVCPLCKSPYWNKPKKFSPGDEKMLVCPVCGKNHDSFLNLAEHMVRSERRKLNEGHQLWLSIFTGKPFDEYAFGKDGQIAILLQKFYRKHRYLPPLEELE
jgi:hypothetical protein